MARTSGSTADNTEKRIAEALAMLTEGVTRATAARTLAIQYKVSTRTARRWVQAAVCDHFDAPLTDCELGFTLASAIERLELLADQARDEGDLKNQIAASKAAASIASQRLSAIERTRLTGQRLGINSGV